MFYEIFLSPQVKRWAIVIYKHSISSRFAQPSPAQPSPHAKMKAPQLEQPGAKKRPPPAPPGNRPPNPPPRTETNRPDINQPAQPPTPRPKPQNPAKVRQTSKAASQPDQPAQPHHTPAINQPSTTKVFETYRNNSWLVSLFSFFFFFCLFCLFFFCFDTNLFYLSALIPERAMRAENQPALLYHWFALVAHCNFGIPANSLYTMGNLSWFFLFIFDEIFRDFIPRLAAQVFYFFCMK